jgi:TP901 family phage tail tape measure protein
MGEARAEMKETDSSFAQAGAFGKVAFLALGAAAVGVGYESVKMAAGFDQAMEMIHTQAGASQAEVDALKGKVLDLAPAVGMGPEQLATGLYHIESAGFRAGQAMDILTAAAKLSQIGQSDFETTAQAVVGVMASQIKGVKDAADAGNLLNTTVGMGDMKMQQLAEAIGTGILPKAAAAGLSFEDVGAALATLTDNVTPANEAATRLGMTFSMMSAPTAKAKAAYEAIGMTSTQLANDMRGPGGLSAALQDLQNHLNKTYPAGHAVKLSLQEQQAELKTYSQSLADMGVPLDQQTTLLAQFKANLEKSGSAAVKQSEALSAMFGGGKSSGTMMTLLGEMDRFKEKTDQYGTAASRAKQAQEAWQAQQAQFSQQIKQIAAQFEVWGVKLGNILIPVLQRFLTWIRDGASWIRQHKLALDILVGVLGGALVAALYAATAATIAWTAALDVNPVFLIIAAIGALVGGLIYAYKHFEGFRNVVDAVGRFFKALWTDALHAVGAVVRWFTDGPLQWFKARINEFKQFWSQHGQEIITIAKKAWEIISTLIKVYWAVITGIFKTGVAVIEQVWRFVWDVIKNVVKTAWDLVKNIVETGWHLILNVFSLFADLLTGKWSKLWGDFKKIVNQLLGDIGKTIGNFAKDALNLLYQAGKDIIQGLINGVKSMGSAAWDAVKSIGSSIKHGFTSLFGIGSPSRLFHEYGKNIGQGLVNGITSMHGDASRAALGLGNAALGGFGATGLGGMLAGSGIGGGVSSGGGVIVVVNVQGGVHSDAGIAKVVRQEVLRYQQRNSRNNLALSTF